MSLSSFCVGNPCLGIGPALRCDLYNQLDSTAEK